jgi:ELWxxDGT repeat protein
MPIIRPVQGMLLLVLFALSLGSAHSQTASLVRDINATGPGRSLQPEVLYSVPGKVLFFGDGGLWVSYGTSAGTSLLTDFCPNSDCTRPERFLGDVNGTVLWMVGVGGGGKRLWRSDGTRPGTYPLTGPGTGIAVASVGSIHEEQTYTFFQGAFYFIGCQEHFNECKTYRTDGSLAGTVEAGFHASLPTPVGNRLFFVLYAVSDTESHYELRVTGGTPGGGTALASFNAPPQTLTAAGNRLFFTADEEVWVSDGTPAGTRVVTSFPAGGPYTRQLKAVGSRVYFVADDIIHGEEIWVSEGTPQSTWRVTEFGYHDPLPSDGRYMEEVNGRLVFEAYDGIHPYGLWTTTGTPESTAPLPSPETCSYCEFLGYPTLVKAGHRILFRGHDAEHGSELWSTDGTPAGTRLVADICPGICSSIFLDDQILPWPGGALLLPALDGLHGPEMWFSDGTLPGTRRMTDLEADDALSFIYDFPPVAMGGEIYFAAQITFEEGGALWATEGDPSSTRMVARTSRSEPSSFPTFLTAAGERLNFTASDGAGLWSTLGSPASTFQVQAASDGSEILWVSAAGSLTYFWERGREQRLWRTDGTAAGTFVLAEDPDEDFYLPGVAFQGKLYFNTVTKLWVTDGTIQGTGPIFVEDSEVHSLAAVGGALYFATRNEVWSSNGTAAGTVKLADVPDIFDNGRPQFASSGPLVYFTAGGQIWRTDGTPGGTQALGLPRGPLGLTTFQGGIAFFANSREGNRVLWRSDGTDIGTVEVASLMSDTSGSPLTLFTGKLFFSAFDTEHGEEFWTSDGTAAGTILLHDIAPGSGSSFPRRFIVAGGRLFFVANDGIHGAELWVSDGTAAGTRMVQDLYPYAHSSEPDLLTVAGNRLYFTADDGATGRELWSLDLAAGPGCQPSSTRLCLNGGRFQVEAVWKDFQGNSGAGQAVALTPDTGWFWFFSPSNVEAVLKVLDGRGLNNHFWTFYGALSSVEYNLTVTDTQTGAAKRYYNPPGQLASVGDTNGFGPLGAFSSKKTPRSLEPLTLIDSRIAPVIGPCLPTAERLCLNGGRFAVETNWKDFQGKTGTGKSTVLTNDTGWFWFFDPANVEVMIKVLDGTSLNGKHWVFYGALSSVEYTITVTDTQTGVQKIYKNPSGTLASVADTNAF